MLLNFSLLKSFLTNKTSMMEFLRAFFMLNICALIFFILVPWTVQESTNKPTMSSESFRSAAESCNQTRNNTINHKEARIPNIVHYIWYAEEEKQLQFQHLLSVLSVHKILQPDTIYFHTNLPPVGKYWDAVKSLPRLVVNMRKPPTVLFNETIKTPMYYTSHSNVDRVVVLREFGGIYLDLDTIVIRPMDDLRYKYEAIISLESDTKACGSIILSSKDAFFLLLWLNAYIDDYRMEEWAYNSGQVPFNLARRYPHLVHVEATRMNRPNFLELDYIWGRGRFNWQDNYALHIWFRLWKNRSPLFNGILPDEHTIRTMDTTFGMIARSIYYGSSDLLPGS